MKKCSVKLECTVKTIVTVWYDFILAFIMCFYIFTVVSSILPFLQLRQNLDKKDKKKKKKKDKKERKGEKSRKDKKHKKRSSDSDDDDNNKKYRYATFKILTFFYKNVGTLQKPRAGHKEKNRQISCMCMW